MTIFKRCRVIPQLASRQKCKLVVMRNNPFTKVFRTDYPYEGRISQNKECRLLQHSSHRPGSLRLTPPPIVPISPRPLSVFSLHPVTLNFNQNPPCGARGLWSVPVHFSDTQSTATLNVSIARCKRSTFVCLCEVVSASLGP